MPTLYLVDGHAQFFRAYHAIRPGMKSPVTGEPTNMTFGFLGMILKVLRGDRPDYLAVVIDASGDQGTFRSRIYPQYKANRKPPPEDLDPQVERCVSLLGQMRIPVLAVEGVEADDTIATVVRRLRRDRPDLEIRIVSRDKDLGQLVDPMVHLFDPQTDTVLGVEQLFESKGVRPEQVVDMLALMGDPVDNVPGVRGVGTKTAAKLITEFGSLDSLLANLDRVKGKTGEAIAAQRDVLPLSRSLVTLKDDVDVAFALEDARVDPSRVDPGPVLDEVHRLGFNRHQQDLRAWLGVTESARPATGGPKAGTVRPAAARSAEPPEEFGLFNPPPQEQFAAPAVDGPAMQAFARGDYRSITDRASLEEWIDQARAAAAAGGRLAFDVETSSLSPVSADLCGVSMSFRGGHAVYVPLRSPTPGAHLDQVTAVPLLRGILGDPSVPKTAHNAKFDLVALRAAGIAVHGLAGDSMVASYVVDATRGTHRMDALAEAELGLRPIPITDLIGVGRHQRRFDEVDLALAVPYAAEDADVALRLAEVLEARLDAMGLGRLYREVEVPLVGVLAEMEFNGIRVDAEELERQRRALEVRIARHKADIEAAAPHPFNVDSPKQLAEVLFNAPDAARPGLGIKVVKRTKTGASTDVEVLERLAMDPEVDSPIPARILEYRQLSKLVGTYLVALREAIDPRTGRIHASFHQTVTATGRLSSSDPNLQNIPIRTEVGRDIRRAFVAEPGHVLLSADYSQIELRVLAHLSGDPSLIAAFESGADIHRAVAAEVCDVPLAEVTDEQRSAAKMVNFGIIYGITPWGLARRLGGGTGTDRARRIIEDYKRRFAGIEAFLSRCVREAREHGHVATILGRRRAVPQVESRNPAERALGERIAINTVVQGSAADLIKLAMLAIHRDLPATVPGARMLLQIHDELVFEVPEAGADALDAFVRDRMAHAMELRVPLEVSTGRGATWAEA